jgi:hypothetical protein
VEIAARPNGGRVPPGRSSPARAQLHRHCPGPIPFTSRTTKVLELALREALSLDVNDIGTEHVLLGIVA